MIRPLLAALLLCISAGATATLRAQGPPPPPPPVPPPPVPPGNPITLAKANLGKVLFWDEQLSSTRTVACGTCHIPSKGGSDPRTVSLAAISQNPGFDGVFGTADDVAGSLGVVANGATGVMTKTAPFQFREQVTSRKAPTMINAAFDQSLFWDGRADSSFEDPLTNAVVLPNIAALESQAAGPPASSVEMGHTGRDWNDVATRVATTSEPLALATNLPAALSTWINGRTYPLLFNEAFGSASVTPTRIIEAIATYERTLISDQAPVDVPGGLTPQQANGFAIFNGQGRCNICHGGPLFTDNNFHNVGVRPSTEDIGRATVTGNSNDNGKMKTPGLRNVALRAPFFHNGSKATLADVVDFYNRGGDFHDNQDPAIIPLGLSATQRANLVAFLGALTDARVQNQTAPFDRPTLYRESSHVPTTLRTGAAGSGGFVPRWVAFDPPYVGNERFSFAIADGRGSATTLLALDTALSAPGTMVAGVPFHLAGSASLLVTALGSMSDSGAGQGYLSYVVALANNPALVGQSIFAQAFTVDAGAAAGLAATNALQITFFSL